MGGVVGDQTSGARLAERREKPSSFDTPVPHPARRLGRTPRSDYISDESHYQCSGGDTDRSGPGPALVVLRCRSGVGRRRGDGRPGLSVAFTPRRGCPRSSRSRAFLGWPRSAAARRPVRTGAGERGATRRRSTRRVSSWRTHAGILTPAGALPGSRGRNCPKTGTWQWGNASRERSIIGLPWTVVGGCGSCGRLRAIVPRFKSILNEA